MAKTQPIYSTNGIYQCTTPNWEPLQLVLHEDDLVGWFMWMFETECEGSIHLHAYKHVTTRRYLYLTPGGKAYWYDASVPLSKPSRYTPVALDRAITAALGDWWDDPHATEREKRFAREAIERAQQEDEGV